LVLLSIFWRLDSNTYFKRKWVNSISNAQLIFFGCIAATIEWKSFFACFEAKKIGMKA